MQSHSTRTPSFPENLQDYAPWVAIHGLLAPYGKCQCGCENDAPISPVTRRKTGQVRGQPQRVLVGHKVTFVDEPNPGGLCLCGCGLPTPIAKLTNSRTGVLRGKPVRYVYGHFQKMIRSLEERFWEKVRKGEPNECWLWTAGDNGNGYGTFMPRSDLSPRHEYAHRVAYMLTYGPIPDGIEVCHSCDANYPPGDKSYRRCVNPAHLFAGTRQDNVDDMVSKKRQAYGSRSGQSKLTESDVAAIWEQLKAGVMHREIAKAFGVTRTVISNIYQGVTWSHAGHSGERFGRRARSTATDSSPHETSAAKWGDEA